MHLISKFLFENIITKQIHKTQAKKERRMEGEKEKEEKKGEMVEFLGATVQIDQSVKGNMGLMSELYTYCIYMKGATFKFSFCQ